MLHIRNMKPFTLIAGVNVLEDISVTYAVADVLSSVCRRLAIPFVFKASFDKANRSDHRSYRGPGLTVGLAQLAQIKRELSVPVVTDVHEPHQVAAVAEVRSNVGQGTCTRASEVACLYGDRQDDTGRVCPEAD